MLLDSYKKIYYLTIYIFVSSNIYDSNQNRLKFVNNLMSVF